MPGRARSILPMSAFKAELASVQLVVVYSAAIPSKVVVPTTGGQR